MPKQYNFEGRQMGNDLESVGRTLNQCVAEVLGYSEGCLLAVITQLAVENGEPLFVVE